MASPAFNVTLHHLSSDARDCSLAHADEHLIAANVTQVRDMLYALSEVASRQSIYEPASPEIRIKTDRDVFVIRTRYRRLCFVGWETALRGEDHSVAYIMSVITGSNEHTKAAPKTQRTTPSFRSSHSTPPIESGGVPRWVKVAALLVVILGCNGTALWFLMRPATSLGPPYTLLPAFESNALLTKAAGEYTTGSKEGDRRLVIDAAGTLKLAKYGPQKKVLEETTKTVRGALSEGRAALVTGDPNVLTIKDPDTVILYGNTYKRSAP
jgi:hypothetical protein